METKEIKLEMIERLLNFIYDIGFTLSLIRDEYIYLSYGNYIICIYNPEVFEKRYSLELKKYGPNTYITRGKNEVNFALDDFEVLETEFRDIIRDNKLKKILKEYDY